MKQIYTINDNKMTIWLSHDAICSLSWMGKNKQNTEKVIFFIVK